MLFEQLENVMFLTLTLIFAVVSIVVASIGATYHATVIAHPRVFIAIFHRITSNLSTFFLLHLQAGLHDHQKHDEGHQARTYRLLHRYTWFGIHLARLHVCFISRSRSNWTESPPVTFTCFPPPHLSDSLLPITLFCHCSLLSGIPLRFPVSPTFWWELHVHFQYYDSPLRAVIYHTKARSHSYLMKWTMR